MKSKQNDQSSSEVAAAVDCLSKRFRWNAGARPRLAVILGSGLGEFAESLAEKRKVAFSKVPYFPHSSIAGHSGYVVCGMLGKTSLLCLQGRVHYYEGHGMKAVTFPVQVLGALGIHRLIVTNAAGGINRRFKPGDLMLIRDHISSFVPNPLVGSNNEAWGPRFPDMTDAYSARLRQLAKRAAARLKLPIKEGVYVSVTGPSYESPAEIQMLRRTGADAVGMSTVPEVIVARHIGVECLGISVITNLAAGISDGPLSHKAVLEAGERVKPRLIKLLTLICDAISRLD